MPQGELFRHVLGKVSPAVNLLGSLLRPGVVTANLRHGHSRGQQRCKLAWRGRERGRPSLKCTQLNSLLPTTRSKSGSEKSGTCTFSTKTCQEINPITYQIGDEKWAPPGDGALLWGQRSPAPQWLLPTQKHPNTMPESPEKSKKPQPRLGRRTRFQPRAVGTGGPHVCV